MKRSGDAFAAELSHTAAGSHDVPSGPLLERDDVVGAIADALGLLERGTGTALFLVGAAGIGKTSLINVAERSAQAAGFTVAGAVGSPMETELPFGLLSQAVVALGGGDVEDVVELARLGGQPARFYRTLRWLSDLAAETPLVLALDDLHWADRDSLDLLGFLCRRLARVRMLVFGSLRPEPDCAHEMVEDLASSGRARILALRSLSRQASAELFERIAGYEIDDALRYRIWRACAGTPLLLELAAWGLASSGSLPMAADGENGTALAVDAGAWVGPAGTLAGPLLLGRFAGLGADSFAYLRAASIFGVRFTPSLVGALAGLQSDVTEAVHGRLVRARLLEDLGARRARFVHPLFAQALLESQAASERARLHAQAFKLLAAAGAADALAAEHAVAGGLIGDPLAVEVTARAGRAALAQGALEAACTHLAHAVELAGETPDEELLLDYASALAARARIEEAERVCRGLLARVGLDPVMRARTLSLLARVAYLAGRPAEGQEVNRRAVAAAALVDPASEGAMLLDAVLTGSMRSPLPSVLRLTSRALAILPAEDPLRRPVEFMDAHTRLMLGDPSGRALLERETKRVMQRAPDGDHGWGWTLTVHALNMLKLIEDFDRATKIFAREYARAIEEGAPILIDSLAGAYSDTMYRLGRPREALEVVHDAMALTGASMAPWIDIAQAVLLSDLGRDEEACPHIEMLRSLRATATREYAAVVSLWLDVLDARRLLASGEPERASVTMFDAAHTARLTGFRHPCIVPWAGVGIEAHIAAGDIESTRALIDDLEELSRPLSCRWPRAQVALGRARLAATEGHRDEADGSFEQALSILAELPMPIARAEALEAYGSHLRRSGRPREAREPISLALSLAEQAGVERIARPARAELAAAGGRRRRRREDPDMLTPQEERVAALAAEGMTNTQIGAALHLSPKTVGHHLQHIYAKLGVRSRRDLIARRSEPPL